MKTEIGVVFLKVVQLPKLLLPVLVIQTIHAVTVVMFPTLTLLVIGVLKIINGVVLNHHVNLLVLLQLASLNQITHVVNLLATLLKPMLMVNGVLKTVNGVVFQILAQPLLRVSVAIVMDSTFFQYATIHYQLVLLYTINVVVMVTSVQLNVVRENVLHKDHSKYLYLKYCIKN